MTAFYISTFIHFNISTFLHLYASTFQYFYISTFLQSSISMFLYYCIFPYFQIAGTIRLYISTSLPFYISILLHSRLLYFYILICLDFLQCLYVSTLCCGCSALPFYLPARCAVEERGTVLMVIDSSSLVQILVHCWTWFICAAAISQTCHKSTRRSSGDQEWSDHMLLV